MIMFLFPAASSARCAESVCAVGAFYIFAGEGVEIWGARHNHGRIVSPSFH